MTPEEKAAIRKKQKKACILFVKQALVIFLIFYINDLVEDNVSKLNTESIYGCIAKKQLPGGYKGSDVVFIKTKNNDRIGLHTFNRRLSSMLKKQTDACYNFLFYRHTFLIPNVGTKMLVRVKPSNTTPPSQSKES